MSIRKRHRATLFTCMLTLMLAVPQAASAAQLQGGAPEFAVNESTVAFAGHEWWVIGGEAAGVYQQPDSVTLLAKENEFGESVFRTGTGNEFENAAYDSGNKMYYANNPDGTSWKEPTEYAGSTLQQAMEAIAGEIGAKELAAVKERTLQGGGTAAAPSADGISGQEITQKLWALSLTEWEGIGDNAVRSFTDQYLLRTPHPYYGRARKAKADGAACYVDSAALAKHAVRPALTLDMSQVVFSSSADAETGKSAAAVGAGFVSAEAAAGTVKFTMQDASQTLKVLATREESTQTGSTLRFSYTEATTGENQYVSCVLTDESGNVKYYAKLADSSGAASGELLIPMKDVADGDYTLLVFSEEANGDLYTDFCSAPVSMKVKVAKTGAVVDYKGDVIHEHSLAKTEAKAATCTEGGNTEYWYCEVCGEYYRDAEGTGLITKEETAIEAEGHKYEEGKCAVCGEADPNYKPDDSSRPDDSSKPDDPPKPNDSSKPADTPKTGDNSGIWLYSILLILCGGGYAAVYMMKRRRRNAR